MPVPFSTAHSAFEHFASLYPDNVALKQLSETMTYREVDNAANLLATRLRRDYGVRPGARVTMALRRSVQMVVAVLAVLKAGGQYVPLDGNVVTEGTLEHIIKDTDSAVVLAMTRHMEKATKAANGRAVLDLEKAIQEDAGSTGVKPTELATTNDGVYCVFTSGTTGKPKGVDVLHRNVCNLLTLAPGNVGMAPGRKVAQLLSVSFDMGQWEMLGAMMNGATLVLRTSDNWTDVLKEVEIVIATPTILGRYKASDYPNVKYVAVAGEPCPDKLADEWGAEATFYNSCGPTEITIVNTMHDHIPGGPNNIGKPTPNNIVYVLDENMQRVPIGQPGTMWAAGAGISAGYINLPDLTAKRYVQGEDGVMFNTGDLGRWLPDGSLEPLGRIDDQVKIKGFRVELDGVSAAMESCPGVEKACALLVERELWGFYQPATVNPEEIKKAVGLVQPYYAVPTKYKGLDAFPFTPNGKIDKRQLQQSVFYVAVPPESAANIDTTRRPELAMIHHGVNIMPAETQKASPDLSEKSGWSGSPSESSQSSTSDLSLKKPEAPADPTAAWAGYLETIMPDKRQDKKARNLRHIIFIMYRRLFTIAFVTNMALIIAFACKGWGKDLWKIGTACGANLTVTVLMRQEHVINSLYGIICRMPRSWPLFLRKHAAKIYHFGGLHSGCAVSATGWLIYLAVQIMLNSNGLVSLPTKVLTWVLVGFLCSIVTFAYPKFRVIRHDQFEMVHRFAGWTAIGIVWAQSILLTNDLKGDKSLGLALCKTPLFWMLIVITSCIIYPWLYLRKVDVYPERLSNHAVRLHFNYRSATPGSFQRVATNPLTEWHSFAAISRPGVKGYSLMVSRAGDWTSSIIDNPPSKLWIRSIPTDGVMRICTLFKKLVVIGTGSGMGPCLAVLLAGKVECRVIWTTPKPRETFSNEIVDDVLRADPNAIIYDTRVHGKPDMVKMAYRLYKDCGAEGVVIISNTSLTKKVVYGLESRGVPAFGAIWDS